jgi:transcriptional regulator with XRE-family HTH domain
MGIVVRLTDHARASVGHRSGRSSDFGTPVASSIKGANSAGTPLFDRVSQYQTCDCEVPIRSARGFCPPATSHARLSASVDMTPMYPDLGKNQPRNLSGTLNRSFGSVSAMTKAVNASLGRRVAQRRIALAMSQAALARASGISQQNINSIEKGLVKRPGRIFELAQNLDTTPEWLLYAQGPEVVVRVDPRREAIRLLESLPDERLDPVIRLLKTLQDEAEGKAG